MARALEKNAGSQLTSTSLSRPSKVKIHCLAMKGPKLSAFLTRPQRVSQVGQSEAAVSMKHEGLMNRSKCGGEILEGIADINLPISWFGALPSCYFQRNPKRSESKPPGHDPHALLLPQSSRSGEDILSTFFSGRFTSVSAKSLLSFAVVPTYEVVILITSPFTHIHSVNSSFSHAHS